MKIGIIGAENAHAGEIGWTINVDKKIKGFSVDYLWGETAEFAKTAAKRGKIPNVVKSPKDMLDKIDCLIVDHRHPKYHLKAAIPFVEKGIPTFIDKPFCYRASEGKQFFKIARKHKTPITCFSILPRQNSYRSFMQQMSKLGEIDSGGTYGPCDLKSKYGGIFFYGIHQVELALMTFGYDVVSVLVTKNTPNATGQLMYRSGKIITMNFVKDPNTQFGIMALGKNGFCSKILKFDANPFLDGIKCFTQMFKTGLEPMEYDKILKPIQVLEALEQSLKSNQREKVAK